MPPKHIKQRPWPYRGGEDSFSLAARILILLMLLIAAGMVAVRSVAAQGDLSFSEMAVDSNFPDKLTFRAEASGEFQIVEAELLYYSPSHLSSVSRTRVKVPVDPSSQVELNYEWDTSGQTVVPNTPLLYQWTVWDAEGNSLTSEEQLVRYRDTRFEWQVDENNSIAVWTHDRPAEFGSDVFDLAARAVEAQRELFGEDLTQQIQLIIYNDFDEFAEWHSTVGEFIGGQAFPDVGITTQVVPLGGPQAGWLQDVVPHEISHLYFAQVTHNPTVSIPVWLNEGMASYNEFGNHQPALNRVERVAEQGQLIPLSSLATGFGSHNEARARLAYDEALSAV
ncbi:MAG: peptidase MA family metallohydrolase, partial [Anaerolineales bacterium]